MEQLGYILLKMNAGYAHPPFFAINLNGKPAVMTDGGIILGNLIALHQIGIGVVLAVKLGVIGDSAVESQSGHHGIFYCLLINSRQNPGHPKADRADMGIGWSSGIIGAAAAVHLALRQKLGMNLQSNNGLVAHNRF